MTENVPVPSSPNWLAEWLSNGKIPGAAKAIAQLVGSTANAGSAWINIATVKGQQIQRNIQNDTEASTVLSKALAKAAAKLGIEDSDLVQHAVEQWAGARLKAQVNREKIARRSIEYMERAPGGFTSEQSPEEEWLDIYGGLAEKASKEKLQDTWARVLAGEIRRPGAFSYATLHVISTLDAEVASDLEHFSHQISDEHTIFEPHRFSFTPDFKRIELLKESGIFGSDVTRKTHFNDAGYFVREFGSYCIIARGEAGTAAHLNVAQLTRAGREIFSILSPEVNLENLKPTAKAIVSNSAVHSVQIAKIIDRSGSSYNVETVEEFDKTSL